MQNETRTLSFVIQGEYITDLVRTQYYQEGKEYEKCIELLKVGMCGTDQSEPEIRRLAEDILLGRAALAGNTGDGTYHLEIYEPDDEPELTFSVWNEIEKLKQRTEELRGKYDQLEERYLRAYEFVPEHKQIYVETGSVGSCYGGFGSTLLDSFMKRQLSDSTDDYGWLEPSGKFHPVEWGEHQEWADKWMKNNLSEHDYQNDPTFYAGDYLTERGWVLLHNPSQGIAIPTKKETHRYTKAQKDFLYDYFIERDCEKEANAVFQDD